MMTRSEVLKRCGFTGSREMIDSLDRKRVSRKEFETITSLDGWEIMIDPTNKMTYPRCAICCPGIHAEEVPTTKVAANAGPMSDMDVLVGAPDGGLRCSPEAHERYYKSLKEGAE